ncbi:hypothetical protein ACFX2I_009030 [Malus domestica]
MPLVEALMLHGPAKIGAHALAHKRTHVLTSNWDLTGSGHIRVGSGLVLGSKLQSWAWVMGYARFLGWVWARGLGWAELLGLGWVSQILAK